MTVSSILDSARRRRSPATLPGFHAGRAPGNKGMLYPADPPTVEEIVCVMRHASHDPHGFRLRAMIVMLWRGGLRIQEALALSEHDLDPQRGSVLVRRGKGGHRREVGMDRWGWENLRPWLSERLELPGGPTVLRDRRPDARSTLVGGRGPHRVSPPCRRGRCPATFRSPPAASCARRRARPRRCLAERHPAPARPCQPRHHEHLPAGHRHRGDHLDRACAPGTDDVGNGGASALIDPDARARALT